MTSLRDQLSAYAAYHHDTRNKITHFFGVPLVTFALFILMGWFRFVASPEVPFMSVATVFWLAVLLYYLRLDWGIALLVTPFTLALLWLADRVALWPFHESSLVLLATFVLGWIIQLVGHAWEGRRPALADNILQVFNAPLFLVAEALLFLGFRKDLHATLEAVPQSSPH